MNVSNSLVPGCGKSKWAGRSGRGEEENQQMEEKENVCS
jgi:hypothetical protein